MPRIRSFESRTYEFSLNRLARQLLKHGSVDDVYRVPHRKQTMFIYSDIAAVNTNRVIIQLQRRPKPQGENVVLTICPK